MRMLSAISPLGAFGLSNAGHKEDKVKNLCVTTATRISDRAKILLEVSHDLNYGLNSIQEILDRIKELAVDEIGDLPRMDVLSELWTRLARKDDHEQLKSHTALLKDMTDFYQRSSYVMRETTGALLRVEAELNEFRDDFATPVLILKDHPLEVIISLLRNSGQRLEAGRKRLESIAEGGRPQTGGDAAGARASTITVTASARKTS